MRDHSGCKRKFVRTSEAWYGKSVLSRCDGVSEEISIGLYHPGGGTSGEFIIIWEDLCGKIVPRLKAYDDAWSALSLFSDMLSEMAKVDDENITPDAFCEMLKGLGIEDATKRKDPES